jgi:hypothetical protein
MRVTVNHFAALTFNENNDLGDPDLTEYDGLFEVDMPDAYTPATVARAIEAKYGHPLMAVGVTADDIHPRPLPQYDYVPQGCALCRKIGHPLTEPCQP